MKGTLTYLKIDLSNMTNNERQILKDKFKYMIFYRNLIKKIFTVFVNDTKKNRK